MATSIRIPELPNEILHAIIKHLPPPALKNVRLSSKLLSLMAEGQLFRRMSLVPYADCLETFSQLMRDNPIAQHVRGICYEAQHRYSVDFCPEPSAEGGEAVKKRMQDNGFWCMDEGSLETMLLAECLRSLPMVEEVIVFDRFPPSMHHSPLSLPKLPSYFRRICKGTDIKSFRRTEGVNPVYPSAKLVLLATHFAGAKLSRFQAVDLDHTLFLESSDRRSRLKELPIYKSIFGELKELDLRFQSYRDHTRIANLNFGNLVNAAKNVEQLRLSLPTSYVNTWTDFGPEHSWLTKIVRHSNGKLRTRATFPRLTHISLGSMVCQEPELVALIHNHRHMLQQLDLLQMTLIRSPEQDRPPCWVRLLREVRSCRVSTTLEGNFTNSHRQWWRIEKGEGYRKNLIKSQVEKWASGKGRDICPIEMAAVKLGEDNKEIVPSKEDFFGGDSSFRMRRRCHESVEELDDIDDAYDDEDSVFWDSDGFSDYSEPYDELDYPEWFEDYLDELTGSEYDAALDTAMEHLEHDF